MFGFFFFFFVATGQLESSQPRLGRASLLLRWLELQHLSRICRNPEVLSQAYPLPFPFERVVQSDASSVTRRVCPSSSMHRTSTGEGGIESTSADKEDCTNSEYGTRGIPCLGEGIKLAEKCWSRCRRQGMGKSARPAGGIGTNTVNLLLKFAVVQLLCVPPL